MSISTHYSFKVKSLTSDSTTGYVQNVHWDYVGVSTVGSGDSAVTYQTKKHGIYTFPNGDGTEEGFVEYENLTPQIVENWWSVGIGSTEIEELKGILGRNLDRKINPPITKGTPW